MCKLSRKANDLLSLALTNPNPPAWACELVVARRNEYANEFWQHQTRLRARQVIPRVQPFSAFIAASNEVHCG
jgi:hypothetical protein